MPIDIERLEAAEQARLEAFRRLGTPDPVVLAANIEQGPYFWPGRRTYRAIHRDDAYVLASWGLSDPYEDGRPGLGVEVFLEADANHPWIFPTVAAAAENAIVPGVDMAGQLEEHGVISFELRVQAMPDEWRAASGRTGVLIGLPTGDGPQTYEGADGPVRMAAITLLRPQELEAVVRGGARDAIVEQLRARPNGYRCRLDRPVVSLAEDYVVEPYRPEPAPEPSPPRRRPWWKLW